MKMATDKHLKQQKKMSANLPLPTFNWKSKDQIREWETFKAKAKLYLIGEKIETELQYTHIVLMLGDEGLSRWTQFNLSEDDCKIPETVFNKFSESFGKDRLCLIQQNCTTTSAKKRRRAS